MVDGYDLEVLIDRLVGGDDEDDANNPALLQGLGLHRQEILLLVSQVTHLMREMADAWVQHERQSQVRFGGEVCFVSFVSLLLIFLTNSVRSSKNSSLG